MRASASACRGARAPSPRGVQECHSPPTRSGTLARGWAALPKSPIRRHLGSCALLANARVPLAPLREWPSLAGTWRVECYAIRAPHPPPHYTLDDCSRRPAHADTRSPGFRQRMCACHLPGQASFRHSVECQNIARPHRRSRGLPRPGAHPLRTGMRPIGQPGMADHGYGVVQLRNHLPCRGMGRRAVALVCRAPAPTRSALSATCPLSSLAPATLSLWDWERERSALRD